jgi:lambda family phage portal protein
VRQLIRDFPYLARAVEVSVDHVVGDGIKFQSRVKTAEGALDPTRSQKIESALKFWMDEADFARRLHYYEIMALAKRQDLETGEFLIVKKALPPRSNRYLPFALQLYEGDWLTDLNANPANPAHLVRQGVEYDPVTGEVQAYHLTDPDGWGKAVRVPAADVIHNFKTLRPGQLRGMSPFAPGVLLAKDLQDIMEAELDGSKMAAKYLALVKTPDPAFRQRAAGAQTDAAGKKIESLENAVIEYLRPGEEVTLAHNPRPGANFPPFVKLILTMFAIVTGVPYELLSGNYEGLNYAVSRMVRNDFAHQLRPIAGRHVRHFCLTTFRPALETAVMDGKLDLPGVWRNPAPYLESEWQPPGMESIDPLREVKARVDEIKAGLRSPQEYVQARGRDLQEVLNEIAQAKQMAADLDLDLDLFQISTAVAGNPAAVDEDQRMERMLRMMVQHFPEVFEGGHA